MFFTQEDPDQQLYLSRTDPDELLSSYSPYPFELENCVWPTIEHYFQAMKYTDPSLQEKIRLADTPQQAIKFASGWFKRPRRDWKKIQCVIMTRAVYTQAKTHSDIAAHLLATGDKKLIEDSQYDYYWGCGRDRRGENHYGKVLMNVRAKLRKEQQALGLG